MDGYVAKGIYLVTFARVGKLSPSFISFVLPHSPLLSSHFQKQNQSYLLLLLLKQENFGTGGSEFELALDIEGVFSFAPKSLSF